MQIAEVIIFFILGTLFGSFLNVLIWRLPRSQNITGRSKCPHCSRELGAKNLIPIVSYLVQGGKCSYCQAKLSPRYAIIEIVTGLLFSAAAWQVHLTAPINYVGLLRLVFVLCVLVVVFVIDLEHYLILDAIIWPASAVVLVLTVISDIILRPSPLAYLTWDSLLAAGLAAGFFYVLWKVSRGRWMGFGDVKFAVFLGLALGLANTVVALAAAFILGAALGLLLIAAGKKTLGSKLPFGTFLSVGAALALFFGTSLWQMYLRLIGWM